MGHAADWVWSVPRPAPPQELALVRDMRVRSKYGKVTLIPISKVPLLKLKADFFFEITKTLCHFARCLGANL